MTTEQIRFGLKHDAAQVIEQILYNNAEDVHERLRTQYVSEGVLGSPEDGFQDIRRRIAELLEQENTIQGKKMLLLDILSVDFYEPNLWPELHEALYKDAYVKTKFQNIARGPLDPLNIGLDEIGEEGEEDVEDVVVPTSTPGNSSGINWGSVLTGVLTQAVNVFTPNAVPSNSPSNNYGNNTPTPNKSLSPAAIVGIVTILAVVGWFAYNAFRK